MILQDIKKNNPYIFNSWRGMLYTENRNFTFEEMKEIGLAIKKIKQNRLLNENNTI